ncbi:ACT domain-containing protein [Microvirga alba]|uniref:ACT domain-containing protein n=1 Tax=Microvirga alba TaxID=2791025 RepID=A0A931BPC5_9HYPH|nr:ACT domain-containing protein [Microvirga alba]MBF9232860.1 ACT domain-containing protein [Microvirga alba]
MAGETDLQRLIASMTPVLTPGTYVFATTDNPGPDLVAAALMLFREDEGVTLIVPQALAEAHGLKAIYPCRCITLSIHSSLEAVGFLAAITSALAQAGIGVNPVSAFFHDHLFIAEDRAAEAMEILRGLSAQAGD